MKSAWVKNQTMGGGITHVYKYKSRFSKVRQPERWKQEGGQGKSNRISLTLGSSYMAEFTESETHKVSTEEVIFSSTGGSPTKTNKKNNKKTGFHSLLVCFICSNKENLFCRGTRLGNPVWVPKSLLIARVSHQFNVRAAYIQYI